MKDQDKSRDQLIDEIRILRQHNTRLEKKWKKEKQKECVSKSEFKKLENALIESERRYKNVLETIKLIVLSLDLDGKITFCNDFLLSLTGWKRKEITGINWFDYFIPREIKKTLKQSVFLEIIRQGDIPSYHENEILTKRGDRKIIAWNNTVLKDSAGEIIGITSIGEDITERKKTEDTLRISEERFRMLFMSMNEGFYLSEVIYDDDGNPCDYRYLEVNPKFEQIIGLSHDQIVGKRYKELVPVDTTQWLNTYFEVACTGIPCRYYFYSPEYQLHFETYVYRPTKGQVSVFVMDISDRKQAEKKLQESKARLSNAMDIARLGYWEYDVASDLFTFDDHFYSIFRTTAEKVGGYTMTPERYAKQFLHPDDIHVVANEMKKSLGTSDPNFNRRLEHRILYADGETGYISVNHFVIKDNQGRTIKTYGVNQDITDRKKSEKALEESEELFRKFVEQAPNAIFVHDMEGTILLANNLAYQYTGYSKEALLGLNASEIDAGIIDENHKKKYWETLKFGEFVKFEGTHKRKDGSTYPAEIHLVKILFQGKPMILAFVSDITDRKKAEAEKNKLEEQLRHSQKLEAIGILAGGVAHDFNNLLTAIMGNTNLLSRSIKPNNPMHDELKEIQKASARAASLTRQLLAFSRKQPLQIKVINLNHTIMYTKKMLSRLIGEDIKIVTELHSNLMNVSADPGQIEQVVMNLIVNARDAMPEGGKITIQTGNIIIDDLRNNKTTYLQPGNYVFLKIQDTGLGMDKTTTAQIFDPFFSTKGPGGGTGLGLSVVYGIIRQHKGWIDVKSKVGEGTTFTVYLPDTSHKIIDPDKDTIPDKELRGNKEKILLVEDDEMVNSYSAKVLKNHGYKVYQAKNAAEAIKMFDRKKGDFQLIFSDVVLPDKSGIDLVNLFRSRKPKIKILLSSGYTDHKSQWPVIQKKGYQFLQKPYNTIDLFRAVKKVLS